MNENDFLKGYLSPSGDRLNRAFAHPLPDIEGLRRCGEFIVQCELEDTFCTSMIDGYESDVYHVFLKDAYRNTQNRVTGAFVRAVGTMSIVKKGYPFVSLDVSLRNISMVTGEREGMVTRVYIVLPQADPEQRTVFFDVLSEQAKAGEIGYRQMQSNAAPDFWGPVWMAESKGVDLRFVRRLRDYTWISCKRMIDETAEKIPFDYRPVQENAVFTSAQREHVSFQRLGLSVPAEVQAAYFSVLMSAP